MVAKDPTLDVTVRDGAGQIYALLDTSFSSPLPVYDRYGSVKSTVNTTSEGQTEEFYVDNYPVVWWKSGVWAFLISSYTGMLAAVQASEASATSAADSANSARIAAETALANMTGVTDLQLRDYLNNTSSGSRQALNAIIASVGMTGLTVDTGWSYKVIMLSDGTVRAVPVGTATPATPTGLAAVAGPTSARLSWNVSAGASTYLIYRDGALIKTTGDTTYRDTGVAGTTYVYTVAAQNSYGMRSPLTAPLSVFMNPALNTSPIVSVTTWPTTIPTTGSCIVRVNARDVDAQILALTLSVSTGSLRPTPDPSVWILTL
jgi:hypothetical protein